MNNQPYYYPNIRIVRRNTSKKTGLCSLYLEYTRCKKGDRTRVDYITGVKCYPDEIINGQLSKKSESYKQKQAILSQCNAELIRAITDVRLKYGMSFTKQDIQNSLYGIKKKEISIQEALSEYIEVNNKTEANKEKYRNLITRVKGYEGTRKTKIHELSQKWIDGFATYLQDFQQPSTIAKTFDHIKSALNHCVKSGLIDNYFKDFTYPKEPPRENKVTFSVDEIEIIRNAKDLTEAEERTRDRIEIQCYTGLRHSDLTKISPENITHNGQIIQLQTQKTKTDVYIPINEKLNEVLKRHNYSTKELKISNQKYNESIKSLLEKCGFTEEVDHTYYEKGKKKIKRVPRYSVCASHTWRRSFITNCQNAGIPDLKIMCVTGHKSRKQLDEYHHLQINEIYGITSIL
jgi:integrase